MNVGRTESVLPGVLAVSRELKAVVRQPQAVGLKRRRLPVPKSLIGDCP